MTQLKSIPRGMRNNNPLNVRYVKSNNWAGKVEGENKRDSQFEEFVTLDYGLRAAIVLLYNYIVKNKRDCIRAIIMNWAPMTENNTINYINTVCNMTGLEMTDTVHFHAPYVMINIVQAMAFVECGVMLSPITIYKAYLRVIMEKKVQIKWQPTEAWDTVVLTEWLSYLEEVKEIRNQYLDR